MLSAILSATSACWCKVIFPRNALTQATCMHCSPQHTGESDDDHLSDVDDDIDAYLIKDSKEVKAKEDIWMTMNAEFLEAQEDKARRVRAASYPHLLHVLLLPLRFTASVIAVVDPSK